MLKIIEIKLKEVLKEKGKTLDWLHEESNLSKSTLERYYFSTVRRFDCYLLEVLCTVLDCTPGDLLQIQKQES